MEAQFNRKTALKLRIDNIKQAPYVSATKEFDPSGITLNNEVISRVNVMGVVVDKNATELNIDDATAQIIVRVFDPNLLTSEVQVGKAVQIIGRIREFQGSRYITPEAIACVSPQWLKVRQKEVKEYAITIPQKAVIQEPIELQKVENINAQTILEQIRLNDTGKGATIALIVDKLGPQSEKILDQLIEQGEIFETSPGKVKVLE